MQDGIYIEMTPETPVINRMVDLDTNTAHLPGREIPLGPGQAEILFVLAVNYPNLVPHEKLMWMAYGELVPRMLILQIIRTLRKKLSDTPLRIGNKPCFGYGLEMK